MPPRVWRINLGRAFKSTGAVALKTDRQVYLRNDAKGNLEAIATTHADDLKPAGKEHHVSQIRAVVEKEFS